MCTGWQIDSALLFYSVASVLVSYTDVYLVQVCQLYSDTICYELPYANMILRLVRSAPNSYTFQSRSRRKDQHANCANQYVFSP